jgi:ketosteroid isomerase-like protein
MNKLLLVVIAAILPLATLADDTDSVAETIRALETTFNDAYGVDDLDTYFGMYAEDATLIFYGARQPVPQYRAEWTAEVAAGGGVDRNEMTDLRIQVLADGEVAVATYILETDSHTADGESSTIRAYETDVWQRGADDWKIVSMHYSEAADDE